MARIAGVTLPPNKKIEFALPYIFGVGRTRSQKILTLAKVDPNIRVKDLSDSQVESLRREIESKYRVEGELRREIISNVRRLKEVGSYRGQRHARELPVHGQRTKTNSRTVRHNKRVTMGSGRKDSGQKT